MIVDAGEPALFTTRTGPDSSGVDVHPIMIDGVPHYRLDLHLVESGGYHTIRYDTLTVEQASTLGTTLARDAEAIRLALAARAST
jgi:hypothetical protein